MTSHMIRKCPEIGNLEAVIPEVAMFYLGHVYLFIVHKPEKLDTFIWEGIIFAT